VAREAHSCVTTTMVWPPAASARSVSSTSCVSRGGAAVGRQEEDLGLHRERARDGDPLLLSGRRAAPAMRRRGRRADAVDGFARLRVGARGPSTWWREGDVLRRRQVEEVVALEDEADLLAAGRSSTASGGPSRRSRRRRSTRPDVNGVRQLRQRTASSGPSPTARSAPARRRATVRLMSSGAGASRRAVRVRSCGSPVPNLRSSLRASRVSSSSSRSEAGAGAPGTSQSRGRGR
jgi:hypothetical protein